MKDQIASFHIIAAVDKDFGIGKKGSIPWRLKGDREHFKKITLGGRHDTGKKNAVIMGRKTWESLPKDFRPLPDRINLVLSRKKRIFLPRTVLHARSLDGALSILRSPDWHGKIGKIFVIGGEAVYQKAIRYAACQSLGITHIQKRFDCDAFFPRIPAYFKRVRTSPQRIEGPLKYYFATYRRTD